VRVGIMGYVTVKFLGEEYQVSETINEFLSYDTLLTPMRIKILNTATADIKRDSRISWNGDTMTSHIHGMADKYRKMVEDSAELLVKKLLELGVYDVTSNEMLKDVTTITDINRIENNTFATLLEEGHKIADMRNAGIERAYHYAASNITGSGVSVFTSSFATLMINSVVEKNILLSQAKKADKEYEEAVRNLNSRAMDALDTVYREVMVKEFYPSIVQKLLEFGNKIMSVFLLELTTHGKFDFESVEKYDMQKADGMLKNISQVPDKNGFLKQVFLTCPFSVDVYKECLKQGLLDKETFETAKYFGMGEEIAEEMDNYIKNNLKNSEKIKPVISLLSSYRGTDELSIWKRMYEGTLGNIEGTYKSFNTAISDKKKLDKFIRENIVKNIAEIVNKSVDDITTTIDRKIKSLITEKQYEEFVSMGILLPETIRMSNSSSTSLIDINNEIKSALTECIIEYIEEAKKRFAAYSEEKELFDKELQRKKSELGILKSEKEKLGLFSFSKKKELSAKIESKENEISEFTRTKEPKELWDKFERMYK